MDSSRSEDVRGIKIAMDTYDHLTREQLISLLRRRDLSRRLGLVWERNEIEHEKLLEDGFPLVELDKTLSHGNGSWQNLMIEGDNFQALRFLRAAFKGAVKCIYIDPPYNTGNRDFIYNDRFIDPDDAFKQSKWLEFLYRRLSLARDLLREDGVMLVSINDQNRAYLELLLSHVWPGGRRGTLVWRTRIGDNSGKGCNLSINHEHVLVWANDGFFFQGGEKSYSMYSNPDNNPRGEWRSSDLTQPKNWLERPNGFYPIYDPETNIWYPPNPDRGWAYASELRLSEGQTIRKDTMEELIRQKRVIFPQDGRFKTWDSLEALRAAIVAGEVPKDGTGGLLIREGIDLIPLEFWVGKKIGFGAPRYKRFKSELAEQMQPLSSWVRSTSGKDIVSDEDAIHIESAFTEEGSKELRRLLGDKAFPYPKPPSLLSGLIDQSTEPGDIILDFFAGSATTAHAVALMNAKDADKARKAGTPVPKPRTWIMVSTTEATEAEPEKNIARDVAARRLAALGLDFAYLRMHVEGTDDPCAVWLIPSLELLVTASVSSSEEGSGIRWIKGDGVVLAIVPDLSASLLDELDTYMPPHGCTAFVASFQPGILRQRYGDRTDMQILALPEYLISSLTGRSLP